MALSLKQYTWYDDFNLFLAERIEEEREMSMAMAIKVEDPLPEDVIIEILSWLPVRTLLQFKWVCKSWYAIISSPKFVCKHLKNFYSNSASDCCLAYFSIPHAGELELFEWLIDDKPRVLASASLDMPIHSPYICGPREGIFYMYAHFYGYRALWNPAMDELKILPPITNEPNLLPYLCCSYHEAFGFGFDPVTKDYKVIVMRRRWSETDGETVDGYPLSIFVYSLSTDSWRYCGDTTRYYHLNYNKCYICVNGVFPWLGCYEPYGSNPDVMISFDVVTDACKEVQLPDYNKEHYQCESLAMYHDSIAFFAVHENFLHMWTLDERYCWTKNSVFGPLSDIGKAIGHLMDNKLILASRSSKLVLFDLNTQEIRELGFTKSRCEGIFIYKESLVSIQNRNGCWEEEAAVTESVGQISLSSYDRRAVKKLGKWSQKLQKQILEGMKQFPKRWN